MQDETTSIGGLIAIGLVLWFVVGHPARDIRRWIGAHLSTRIK